MDLRLISYSAMQAHLKDDNTRYLDKHPELHSLVDDFVASVLKERPKVCPSIHTSVILLISHYLLLSSRIL